MILNLKITYEIAKWVISFDMSNREGIYCARPWCIAKVKQKVWK